MLEFLVICLTVLWLLGFVRLGGGIVLPDYMLFTINGRNITLWNLLTLFIIGWIIGILPSPFRQIASVFLILWVLAILGIIVLANLPNVLLVIMILGLILYLFTYRTYSS